MGSLHAKLHNGMQETGFFCGWGGSWDTPYGRFFLEWYSRSLLEHGERLLKAARSIFQFRLPSSRLRRSRQDSAAPALTDSQGLVSSQVHMILHISGMGVRPCSAPGASCQVHLETAWDARQGDRRPFLQALPSLLQRGQAPGVQKAQAKRVERPQKCHLQTS